MAEEKFDKVILQKPGEEAREITPEAFRAIPLGERVDLLVKGCFKFYKDGQPVSALEAMKG